MLDKYDMFNDYVYPIDVPPIGNFLLPGVEKLIFQQINTVSYKVYSAVDLINPDYINWENISWDFVLVFHRPTGHIGRIHTDYATDEFAWGINWIYSGYGYMHYWDNHAINSYSDIVDEEGKTIRQFFSSKEPTKIYRMDIGAYLVNASIPHRAIGVDNRYALSLRAKSPNPFKSWDEVLNKFHKRIIKTPGP